MIIDAFDLLAFLLMLHLTQTDGKHLFSSSRIHGGSVYV